MSQAPDLIGEAPDLIEPVVGFRKWRLEDEHLRSPYVSLRWREPVLEAQCHRRELQYTFFGQEWVEDEHQPPHPACKCGIYAYYRPRHRSSLIYVASVFGIVTLWGRIEAHCDGMRAQYARVQALAFAPEWGSRHKQAVERAADELGVELVDYGRLKTAAKKYGRPLPASLVPHRSN